MINHVMLFSLFFALVFMPQGAVAVDLGQLEIQPMVSCKQVSCNSHQTYQEISNDSGCANQSYSCYEMQEAIYADGGRRTTYYRVANCSSGCSGMEKRQVLTQCSPGLPVYQTRCVTPCTKTCPADTAWTAVEGQNYSRRTRYTLNSSSCICMALIEEGCNPGYYDARTNTSLELSPTCERCSEHTDTPSWAAVTGYIGARSAEECFQPTGLSFTDTTGTYEYVESCYYSAD